MIILFLLISCNTLAQQFDPDTLKLKLQQQLPDSDRIIVLSNLAFTNLEANTDTALKQLDEAFQLAHKNNDQSGLASCNNTLGWYYFLKGKSDTALQLLFGSLSYYQKIGDRKDIALIYTNLAEIYYSSKQNYVQALEYAKKAEDLNESLNDFKQLITVYKMLGMIYRDQLQYDDAVGYFEKAIKLAKEKNEKSVQSDVFTALGILYLRKNEHADALRCFSESEKLSREINRSYGVAMAKENLGDTYLAMKKYPEALSSYQFASDYFESVNRPADWGYECFNVGKVESALKKYDEATFSFQHALQLFAVSGVKSYQPDVFEAMSINYSNHGDFENAYEYYKRFVSLRDSSSSQQQKKLLAELTTRYKTEQKEKENQLLKAQNDITNAQLASNRAWLIVTLISIALLTVLAFILYRNRQLKIKNIHALKELNEQLELQKEEISRMNSILELRALRSQMNPHFIFNCMSSIQECILLGKIDDANKYLSKLSRLLRMVLEHSEEESVSLDRELEMLELYLQLESVRLKDNFDYEIKVGTSVFPEEVQVPTLMLQPFAENAIWHGLLPKEKNRFLKIEITSGEDLLTCIIEDNGVGRERSGVLQQAKRHHTSKGIRIARDRFTILKKQFHNPHAGFEIIDLYNGSHVPAGTRVEIKLPLEAMRE